MFHKSKNGRYTLLKLPRKVRAQRRPRGFPIQIELTSQLLSNLKKLGTVPYRRASLCSLPIELLTMIVNLSDPVDLVCLALASKHLLQVANSVGLTMPVGLPLSDDDSAWSLRKADLVRARETWYELVGERLIGNWVSRTLRVCTGCYVVRPRSPEYWLRQLDEIKSRSSWQTPRITANWRKAEKNGSLAKCVEMWCAKVPKGNVCPVCLTLKQGVMGKKYGGRLVQSQVEEMSAGGMLQIALQWTLLSGFDIQNY